MLQKLGPRISGCRTCLRNAPRRRRYRVTACVQHRDPVSISWIPGLAQMLMRDRHPHNFPPLILGQRGGARTMQSKRALTLMLLLLPVHPGEFGSVI